MIHENVLESLMSFSDDISGVFTKVDLNTASSEDLLLIPGMTSDFASSIIVYRRKAKFIYSINELLLLMERLQPFCHRSIVMLRYYRKKISK